MVGICDLKFCMVGIFNYFYSTSGEVCQNNVSRAGQMVKARCWSWPRPIAKQTKPFSNKWNAHAKPMVPGLHRGSAVAAPHMRMNKGLFGAKRMYLGRCSTASSLRGKQSQQRYGWRRPQNQQHLHPKQQKYPWQQATAIATATSTPFCAQGQKQLPWSMWASGKQAWVANKWKQKCKANRPLGILISRSSALLKRFLFQPHVPDQIADNPYCWRRVRPLCFVRVPPWLLW